MWGARRGGQTRALLAATGGDTWSTAVGLEGAEKRALVMLCVGLLR